MFILSTLQYFKTSDIKYPVNIVYLNFNLMFTLNVYTIHTYILEVGVMK